MNKLFRWAISAALVVMSVFVACCLLEVALRITNREPDLAKTGPRAILASFKNAFMNNPGAPCDFGEMVQAHPHLGFVRRRSDGADLCLSANRQGFNDTEDLPETREARFFTILLSGGSVADILGSSRSWLEAELNNNYISPNGLPFLVFNIGMGGSQTPYQLRAVQAHGRIADGVVFLDGYNEALGSQGLTPDHPPELVSVLFGETVISNTLVLGLRRLYRAALDHALIGDSFLVFHVFRAGMKFLEERVWAMNHRLYFDYFLREPGEKEAADRENFNRLANYEAIILRTSKLVGARYAHFLQPAPPFGKTLTESEKSYFQYLAPATYHLFQGQFRDFTRKGYPARPLIDVFASEKGDIYSDHVHYIVGEKPEESRGNILVSRRMAQELAKLWNLRRKR